LAAKHGADLKFTPERGWLVYDGRRWAVDDKAIEVQARAKDTAMAIFDEIKDAPDRDARMRHAKRSQSKNSIEAMIWLARSEPGIPARLTDLDRDGWQFNVANGTIDLRTGTIRPHAREDLISNVVDIVYDPHATCPLWDAFLWRVLDHNADLCGYLRRFVGYLLVGDTTEQSLHFLFGLGANGKSVFCEVLMRLLGDYALAASPDLIMLKKYGGIPNDIARLRGVRAAMMNETSQGARFDEAKLKDLTGGDTLTARFLHQEFFDFEPTHRIVIRGNHKPAISGTDEGIWRRLRLVPFTEAPGRTARNPQLGIAGLSGMASGWAQAAGHRRRGCGRIPRGVRHVGTLHRRVLSNPKPCSSEILEPLQGIPGILRTWRRTLDGFKRLSGRDATARL
jgi:putative DNA primase/helicase